MSWSGLGPTANRSRATPQDGMRSRNVCGEERQRCCPDPPPDLEAKPDLGQPIADHILIILVVDCVLVKSSLRRRGVRFAVCLASALSSAVGAQAASRVLITVRATAAPVCPVERNPPDPACVPRPLSGLVVTANTPDGVVATRGVTRSDGGVILRVRAGATYMIHAWMPGPDDRPAVLPRCDVIGLTVGRRPRNVMLHCDTGIR